ncbi:CHAT domain-containing protein [Aspergillus saccharolyticus JOP 1030-1]|uniref:CHAT domain-containing protein n=1 Tax=Aspergillus saccharolyticus JOP 1030-1 TaxID=1450539 RepID=A0A318ZQV2_9EURO|nr:hypothetical protein BP01DRAFT_352511 [Aspergillus saccharolyticus JOP 1030-1]PYH49981.1 hypothetical protein BP01DRAFT_352511 [Aspergillus saccharolyticus JOP 1030-1]
MEFNHFISLCGRSLFTEEYRGDLDAAWEALQQAKSSVSPAEPEPHAEYLRCLIIYSILTGKIQDAQESLNALYELLGRVSSEWGLRYTNYQLLCDYYRRYPPLLHFFHERGRPINLVILSDIIGPQAIMSKFTENFQRYFPTGSSQDQVTCQILGAVQWLPMQVRTLVATYHPSFPTTAPPDHSKTVDWDAVIPENAKFLIKYRELARSHGATTIANYLSRLIVEFHLACQHPNQVSALTDLYRDYESLEDLIGMANCKLMEGDNLLSPPFASPMSLNMVLVEASSAVGPDTLWDPVDFNLKFEHTSQAKDCYESALSLFRNGDCKRGQAAILLRQACCLHNEIRYLCRAGKCSDELFNEAEEKLCQAHGLFGRDEVSTRMVEAHQILLSISRGVPAKIKVMAQRIGEWGIEARNEQVAHALGLLMMRFAHHEWSRFGNLDTATLAWECASEVFNALQDVIPEFQTLMSRAVAYHEMFNGPAVKIIASKALNMVDSVIDAYNRILNDAPDTPMGLLDRKTLLASKFNTLWTFETNIVQIFLRLEELELLDDWQKKLLTIIEGDESFQHFIGAIEQRNDARKLLPDLGYSQDRLKGLWKETMAHHAVRLKYASADIRRRQYLAEGNIDEANKVLRCFVNDAEKMERVYTRDLYRILACENSGDRAKARSILDDINDDMLFGGTLEGFLQGKALKTRFPAIAENALIFTIYGNDMDRALKIVNLIRKIDADFFDWSFEHIYNYSYRIGNYGSILLGNNYPQEAFHQLLEARRLIEIRRTHTTDIDSRIGNSMSRWLYDVFLDLARSCLRCEEADVPLAVLSRYEHGHPGKISWPEHALLFLEESRARVVLDSLKDELTSGRETDTRLTLLSEAIYKQRALRMLLALDHPSPEQEEEISQLQKEIDELKYHELPPATTQFIVATNSTVEPRLLYGNIDDDAVVLEATFGIRGFVAFAITRDGIQNVHYGGASTVDMQKPAMRFMQVMRELSGYHGEEEDKRKRILSELSAEISSVLVTPFAAIVRQKAHVIFSISEPFTAFPFSALLFDGKPLIAHASVSQIPSLTVLHYVSQRRSASRSPAPTVTVFAKSPVGTSTPKTRAGDEADLHMAGIEAVNIARMFSTWPVEASGLSRKRFREYIKGTSSVLHIGTHGDVNRKNPLMSSISIGEDFRVLDLSELQSNANLIVFAACLSGLGKATLGSEFLGFSHVVLGTGCQAFMGTLWKVSDFGSMLLMTTFYRNLKEKRHLSLAEALRDAQTELLCFDSEKASRFLDNLLESWTSETAGENCPAEFVPDAEFFLFTSKMILDELDWSSPFFWAPFMLMGYGGHHLSFQGTL